MVLDRCRIVAGSPNPPRIPSEFSQNHPEYLGIRPEFRQDLGLRPRSWTRIGIWHWDGVGPGSEPGWSRIQDRVGPESRIRLVQDPGVGLSRIQDRSQDLGSGTARTVRALCWVQASTSPRQHIINVAPRWRMPPFVCWSKSDGFPSKSYGFLLRVSSP